MSHPRFRLSVLAALVAAACPLMAQATVPAGAAAEIISLQGTGDQRAAAAADWGPARLAQALAQGDFVRTRQAAKMALLFADDTQLRLHQNTVLQVKGVATPAQPVTTLLLNAGRAWTQTKRADGSRLNLETPAATAAIRGTDWDISVEDDGRTLITVLSGTVEFSNAQGSVSVGANEAALAEVGKAPVKLVLSQPRDRIQWVNALRADPVHHLSAEPVPAALAPVRDALAARDLAAARAALAQARTTAAPAWVEVFDAAVALQAGDLLAARGSLARQVAGADAAPLPAWLMQSDVQLMEGEGAAAATTLRTALQRWPAHPALVAQLARVQILSDRVDEAVATLAPAQGTAHADLALVRAELARRRGDAPGTLAAYAEAQTLAPGDARAWQGLGSAHAEREDPRPARENLRRALQLSPQSPGAWGELGTLETFVNEFTEAGQAFATALGDNPADYVALTGQGLLHLKQGQPDAALDAFLRAGVMEPRYARAKTWTAVAYYQLGRHQDALTTLQQAIVLDDKDPVPHMLLAQIHTDLFQPGEAVEAARAAVARMPYLKSLNQVANDQKGSANLGASLAFFGMEDWALEMAQQSFYPYWGGSHLFMADRYAGEFNKNSALFQGFLTDPMAFGASQRYSSLLQQPGAHGAVGVTLDRDLYRMRAPAVTLNGMDNTHVPVSWFFKAQSAHAAEFPFDLQVNNSPAVRGGYGDVRAHAVTVGAGMQPTERINLFAYANHFDMRLGSQNLFETAMDNQSTQGALGMSYRWGPTEQTWIKIGRSVERILLQRYPTLYLEPPFISLMGVSSLPKKQFNDLQLRHTVDTAPGSRWSVALEHVRERQNNLIAGQAAVAAEIPGVGTYRDDLYVAGYNHVDRRYTGLTLATTQRLDPALSLDATLGLQQIRHRVDGLTQSYLVNLDHLSEVQARRADMERVVTPRVGLVWQPASGTTVRMAYQDWLRPLSVSTLTSVETAGIPVEDRLVEAGGRHKRTVAQVGMEIGANTFVSLRADHLRVRNPGTVGVDLRTPSLPFLEEMRNTQMVNLSNTDLLEDTPTFDTGTLKTLGAGVNHMFSRRWSGYAKYLYQGSESRSFDADVALGRIPYIPRHTAVLGATWASPHRLYLSGRAVYRSERFEDKENLTRLASGWGVDLMGFWESQDKRWVVGAAALNLWAPKSDRRKTRYVLDARYRF
ncbi:TonB-dependent receptor [Acidovorax sp. D2M1]|uniref:TonB-dependent receptor n=1 Tax=Acidovorax benzenivorans TaxID=2987520 RepID=A0ABT5RRQ5_9BURK|nr:tetratricopeptide repeat protein [Acidovorax benzenivorans]MDD2176388.1 TonB-dependent receptor [Acidovorax benzenivorans]